MHRVLRTFTIGRGRPLVNDIVDGSTFRNLGFLIRRGYLQDVGDGHEVTFIEPVEAEVEPPLAEIVLLESEVARQASSESSEAEVPSTSPTTVPSLGNELDILDQIAAAPVVAEATIPAKAALLKLSKAKLIEIGAGLGLELVPTQSAREMAEAIDTKR